MLTLQRAFFSSFSIYLRSHVASDTRTSCPFPSVVTEPVGGVSVGPPTPQDPTLSSGDGLMGWVPPPAAAPRRLGTWTGMGTGTGTGTGTGGIRSVVASVERLIVHAEVLPHGVAGPWLLVNRVGSLLGQDWWSE